MEEEAEKAARLAELKAKAEALRQEKSTLFGMLKQALVEDAKRKAREERLEKQRKEEEAKKEKETAIEAAKALASGAYQNFPDRVQSGPGAAAANADPSLFPGELVLPVPWWLWAVMCRDVRELQLYVAETLTRAARP